VVVLPTSTSRWWSSGGRQGLGSRRIWCSLPKFGHGCSRRLRPCRWWQEAWWLAVELHGSTRSRMKSGQRPRDDGDKSWCGGVLCGMRCCFGQSFEEVGGRRAEKCVTTSTLQWAVLRHLQPSALSSPRTKSDAHSRAQQDPRHPIFSSGPLAPSDS
jgi:hypothetical protein